MKRLRNTSGISDTTVRQVCDWITVDLCIAGFDVECRKSTSKLAGRAYTKGSAYHSTARPFVVLRVGTESRWPLAKRADLKTVRRFPCTVAPYQYAQHKGRRYVLANRIEALVYIAAHELRHLFQAKCLWPRYHGSKGRFSEVDTEAYAIHMLRQWRKLESAH